jgi:hypothetical protein
MIAGTARLRPSRDGSSARRAGSGGSPSRDDLPTPGQRPGVVHDQVMPVVG